MFDQVTGQGNAEIVDSILVSLINFGDLGAPPVT